MAATPLISVIVPTHNPHTERLQRTLLGLARQSLPHDQWECLLIDNASTAALQIDKWESYGPANFKIIRESALGLTHARLKGFLSARGRFIVMVDDDNILDPDYLVRGAQLFDTHPKLGAAGGIITPELAASKPHWWQPEFDGLLACRDLGPKSMIAYDHINPDNGIRSYPIHAPVGAGMFLRGAAVKDWLGQSAHSSLSDRRGGELTSGGDNDIIFSILRAGWSVGYFPELKLQHLIPSGRLTAAYLARLNRGIAQSWVQVLAKHQANPWKPITRWSVPLRQLKAWFTYRAWSGPEQYIRWQGACGHFIGLASLRH